MKELIEALQIFLKYGNLKYPTHCEHDVLYILIDPSIVSEEDKENLDKLGFSVSKEGGFEECFSSFRYGSA